jgi:Secretion system C-terminal sorting domain
MKKQYFLSFALLIAIANYAQLHVDSNTYLFSNNQVVYVTGDVNLKDNTSNFYLRNNSQLLQGTTGSGVNKGTGALSVFQEGTVNNFQYNYWCSPVGKVTSNTSINNPFTILQLGVPNIDLDTRSFALGTPTTSRDGLSSNGNVQVSSRWIYTFTSANTYGQWNRVSEGDITTGLGFTMKGTQGSDTIEPFSGAGDNNPGSAQRYDFRGKPNDGTITSPIAANNYTLIGNPYPSAIDLRLFLGAAPLNDNTNSAVLDGNIYFWEQVVKNSHILAAYEGGYGVYNLTGYNEADFQRVNPDGTLGSILVADGGATIDRRFAPIGQGFKVKGKAGIPAGSVVTMKNTYRVYVKEGSSGSAFLRSASAKVDSEYYDAIPNVAGIDYTKIKKSYPPQIKLHTQYNNQGISSAKLAFTDEATDGYDYGYDAESTSKSSPSRFYFLSNPEKEYSINTVKFDLDKKIPIGLACKEQTNFKVKIVEKLWGFNEKQPIFIHDKETDVYHTINEGHFEIDLPAGIYNSRFEITFKDGRILENEEITLDNVNLYQNNNVKVLVIQNPKLYDLKGIEMYDVSGKSILYKPNLGKNESYEFSTSNYSSGVYIVKLKSAEGKEIAKKITIAN